MFDINQAAIPCGELRDGGNEGKKLSIKSTDLQPITCSTRLINKEVHANNGNLRTVHVSHSKNIFTDALSTKHKDDGNQI